MIRAHSRASAECASGAITASKLGVAVVTRDAVLCSTWFRCSRDTFVQKMVAHPHPLQQTTGVAEG